MQATVNNIYIEGAAGAGSNVVYVWAITVETAGGAPLPTLAGATSTFRIKRAYSDTAALVEATVGNGIVVDSVLGKLTLSLTVTHLTGVDLSVAEADYIYDWDLIDNTGRHYRLYKGTVTIGGNL